MVPIGAASSSSSPYSKPCTLCAKPRDVLIRCQIDATGKWHLVCPGSCWKRVSGGVIDGDKSAEHHYYRYGGVWKNKHDAVSGKKPKAKQRQRNVSSSQPDLPCSESTPSTWSGQEVKYTKNDRVRFQSTIYICRKSHQSDQRKPPHQAYSLWKEDDAAPTTAEDSPQGSHDDEQIATGA